MANHDECISRLYTLYTPFAYRGLDHKADDVAAESGRKAFTFFCNLFPLPCSPFLSADGLPTQFPITDRHIALDLVNSIRVR
jgi:hypothetical protein